MPTTGATKPTLTTPAASVVWAGMAMPGRPLTLTFAPAMPLPAESLTTTRRTTLSPGRGFEGVLEDSITVPVTLTAPVFTSEPEVTR